MFFSKFFRGNDMTKKITKETGGMSHSSVCTTVPTPQIIYVSYFLRGGGSCTQAIYKTYETKGFFLRGGRMPFTI